LPKQHDHNYAMLDKLCELKLYSNFTKEKKRYKRVLKNTKEELSIPILVETLVQNE